MKTRTEELDDMNTMREERDALKAAAQTAIKLLGPTAPDCCGCEYEWNQAITQLRAALAHPEHQPLTDEDIKTMYLRAHDNNMYMGWLAVAVAFARAIEAKLKEKNT